MEKFGIFNILSAINNLTNSKKSDAEPEKKTNAFDNSNVKVSDQNASVSKPPQYIHNPMLDFIKKHDEISQRIDKSNKIEK